jgi:hypothetical protein
MEWIPIILVAFKAAILFTGMFFAIKWHYDQDKKEENETSETQSNTEMRLFATMIIALASSLIGVVYAGCWGNTADGGRGGALGCAFTLLMFIMSRPDARTALTAPEQGDILAEPDPVTLSESLDHLAKLRLESERLRAAFVARLEAAQREKIYLSVASVMSVLAWKFGDIAAAWLNGGH